MVSIDLLQLFIFFYLRIKFCTISFAIGSRILLSFPVQTVFSTVCQTLVPICHHINSLSSKFNTFLISFHELPLTFPPLMILLMFFYSTTFQIIFPNFFLSFPIVFISRPYKETLHDRFQIYIYIASKK